MTVARQRLGRSAEERVSRRLEAAGWVVLARNARVADVRGEIDLIAIDGDALVFVEIKARRAGGALGPVTPAAAVGVAKQRKLRALAAAWLRERGYDVPRHRDLRFDVIGLLVDARGRPLAYDHFRAAF